MPFYSTSAGAASQKIDEPKVISYTQFPSIAKGNSRTETLVCEEGELICLYCGSYGTINTNTMTGCSLITTVPSSKAILVRATSNTITVSVTAGSSSTSLMAIRINDKNKYNTLISSGGTGTYTNLGKNNIFIIAANWGDLLHLSGLNGNKILNMYNVNGRFVLGICFEDTSSISYTCGTYGDNPTGGIVILGIDS